MGSPVSSVVANFSKHLQRVANLFMERLEKKALSSSGALKTTCFEEICRRCLFHTPTCECQGFP